MRPKDIPLGIERPQLDPVLTTVVQPVVEVGRTAVELMASDDDSPRTIMLPTELRLGASCGTDHDVDRPVGADRPAGS